MSYDKLRRRIVGPCTSLVTPLKKDCSLDETGLRENIRFVLEGGFSEGTGVLLACTPGGESPSLSIPERKRAMKIIADEAKGKLPIETSAHDNSQDAVIDMLRYAKDLGFDAIQLQPPWYYGTSNDEVFRFYSAVTKSVDIGIIVYNSTWLGILDGVGLQEPLVERLSELDPIIGIKWSSPNWYTYINVLREWKHRFAFTDNQYHGMGCFWGCQSFLDVTAQFYPAYPLERWRLIQKREFDKAVENLWELELPYYLWLNKMIKQGIHGEGPLVKLPMRLVGRPSGPSKPPYDAQFSKSQVEELREIMAKGRVPKLKPS